MGHRYEIGQKVQALKRDNAMGVYFPGEITAVHEEPARSPTEWPDTHNILGHFLANLCSCGLLCRPTNLYDIQYPDGTFDQRLTPDKIRPAVPSVNA